MGCTSSTPNMVTATIHPTDKILHFSEDTEDQKHNDDILNRTNDGNGTNEKVLPSCDTLEESIQLDRTNKSLIDTLGTPNVQFKKVSDLNANGHVMDGDNNTVAQGNNSQIEDKLSSLEDVVDKVVELFIEEHNITEDVINISEVLTEPTNDIDHSRIKIEETPVETGGVLNADIKPEIMEEKLEEAISPSQSTSSRATRWEALADIAAELPPSLTVDPVTGQIYALSK